MSAVTPEALLEAVIDAETDTAYCHASERLAEAAPQILALLKGRTPAPEGEACPTCNGVHQEFCSNAFHLHASPVVPKTAAEIKAVVMAWLDADDPASWDDFEKRLNAAVSNEAFPVVPVASGQADKMAHVLRGMVKRGTLIDAEAIDRALNLATYRQDPDDDDRAWAASQAEVIGQPVVPVGREEIEAIIHDTVSTLYGGILLYVDKAADAILAALRPTDTGREG